MPDLLHYDGLAIVAFVDLLGFSAAVEQTWDSPSRVLDVVLRIKKTIQERKNLTLIYQGWQSRADLMTISDCFVIRVNLPHPEALLVTMQSVFTIVAIIMTEATKDGFAVRGGVELKKVYWQDHETIGPAFNAAYFLESKVAKQARVILGPKLCAAFNETYRGYGRATAALVGQSVYQSADGLMSMQPPLETADTMRSIQQSAPDNKRQKYDEWINQAALAEKERHITLQNWRDAERAVRLASERKTEESGEASGAALASTTITQANTIQPKRSLRRQKKHRRG